MRKLLVFIFFSLLLSVEADAWWTRSMNTDVRTLRAVLNDDWMLMPVLELGSDDVLSLSFDEMSHAYHRFTYRIEHCDAAWKPSSLIESDWLDGFQDMPIEDWQNSRATTFDYTHYTLDIPNDDVQLKLSGNYQLTVSEAGKPVAQFRFCIVEPLMGIGLDYTVDTDIDTRMSHQQVEMSIGYGSLAVRNPMRELKVFVMQNRQAESAVVNPEPSFSKAGGLEYSHCRDLIFDAGNEYRRFEVIDMYDYLQNVDRVTYHAPYFHIDLFEDVPRRDYYLDEDHNGRYLVRKWQSDDSDIEADYMLVHFSLASPYLTGGSVYVDADFTGGSRTDEWRMDYAEGHYEKTLLLKQGSYDYRYVMVPGSDGAVTGLDGNWFETENSYAAFVYYRPAAARYDRLVGFSVIEKE